ncbi:helix-turn-helix domain-containing protein [Kitasatospora purpeofusca]|uniref:helix-turn-helix domain-containing protein n=1 Tax=Kitasatospora purpeofusca TaxID=67352 RepID=UPI0037F94AA5
MGSAWKQLPDDLSDPARRLTEELRAVKDATGLSLSELAARTHYSRASWERWLNGKRVITSQALEALVGAVDCDGPKLRGLWELTTAEGATSGDPAPTDAAETAETAGAAGAAEESDGPDRESGADVEAATATDGAPADSSSADSTGADALGADGTGTGSTPELTSVPAPDRARTVERPTGPVRGRSMALIAASVVAVLLLALAGVRYFSGADEDKVGPTAATVLPSTSTTPVDSASPSTSPPAVPANPAPAVPACQALGCAHKDPKAAGCGGDARTLLTTNIGKVVIYLRYSQKCQAAWAAITEGQPGDQATITTSAGESETALIHWGYDNYSQMVNAGDPSAVLQVCGKQAQPEGTSCTSSISDLARVVANTPIPVGPASPPAAAGDPAPAPTPSS